MGGKPKQWAEEGSGGFGRDERKTRVRLRETESLERERFRLK